MLRACVIGWPVEHSRSPIIHRYWLAKYGIDGAYDKEAVAPDALAEFLGSLKRCGYVGANVTLPHKEAALAAACVADESAVTIGAANTLWLGLDGDLHAANTDASGFMRNIDAEAPQWNEGLDAVMVLGAGGAARAVLFGLIEAGVPRILLANRTRARADALAKVFGPSIEVIDWEKRSEALGACGALINPTSLGMTGQAPLAPSSPTLSITRLRRNCLARRGPVGLPPSTVLVCCSIKRCLGSSAGSGSAPRSRLN